MGKSKKKKKSNSGPPKPKTIIVHMQQRNKNGDDIAHAHLCLTDFQDIPTEPDAVVYLGSKAKSLMIFDNAREEYDNKLQEFKNDPAKQAEYVQYYNNEHAPVVRKQCLDIFTRFMAHIKDFDMALDLNTEISQNTVFDHLDLRDYMKNKFIFGPSIFEEVNDFINSDDFEYDPSWLWSTSEYFKIQLSDNLTYVCHRIMYDENYHAARYLCVEYRRFHMVGDQYIEIPVLWFYFQVTDANVNMDTLTASHNAIMEPKEFPDTWKFETYYKGAKASRPVDRMDNTFVDSYVDKYGRYFKALRLNIGGMLFLPDMVDFIILDKKGYVGKHANTQTAGRINSIMRAEVYPSFQRAKTPKEAEELSAVALKTHLITAASLIATSLFVTNKRLKEKKLSKPIHITNPDSSVTYKSEIILENQPERKTRILGDNIKITSEKRPEIPTMDRIIKYHTPEWGRKEHLRRLSSGKVVKVKAATCKRKCVDMHGAKSNLPQQGVDYKLTPSVLR